MLKYWVVSFQGVNSKSAEYPHLPQLQHLSQAHEAMRRAGAMVTVLTSPWYAFVDPEAKLMAAATDGWRAEGLGRDEEVTAAHLFVSLSAGAGL